MSEDSIQIEYHPGGQEIEAVLGAVSQPGDFFIQGRLEIPMPKLDVAGVGTLSFPVPASQVAALIEQATKAPFGRGEETLLDESVRKTWQISKDRVALGGKSWPASFGAVMEQVCAGLGRDPKQTKAELYKLLVYSRGGFFAAHRDTEKAGGMFATLVVVLPCAHRGGELVVRHTGREVRLDLSDAGTSEIAFAAFYADCEHEVLPVTDGTRICLTFNLLRTDGGKSVSAPDHTQAIGQLTPLLRSAFASNEAPAKLVWLLEHHYTPAELAPAALKGCDDARYRALAGAARAAGCTARLGLVHIKESGPAQPIYDQGSYHRRGRRGYYEVDDEPDDFEVIEVSDSACYIDQWKDEAGAPLDLRAIPIDPGELLPDGALDDEEPDEKRLTEATGNEGASFERSYLRAAVAFWPEARTSRVLLQAGVGAVLPLLRERVDALKADASLREETEDLARRMIDDWSRDAWRYASGEPSERPDRATMLRLLLKIDRSNLIESFVLSEAFDHYEGKENAALLACAGHVGAAKAAAWLEPLTALRAPVRWSDCCALFAGLAARRDRDRRPASWDGVLRRLATQLSDTLGALAQGARPPDQPAWTAVAAPPDSAAVSAFLITLRELDFSALRETVATRIAAHTAAFDPVTQVVPTIVALRGPAGSAAADPVRDALWLHAARFLLERSARPPEAPRDWRQEVQWPCSCKLCRELRTFLCDPVAREHVFRLRADLRYHIEGEIRGHDLLLDCRTATNTRPHALTCRKNNQGYFRRCSEYTKDIEAMGILLDRDDGDADLRRQLRDAVQARRSWEPAPLPD